MLRGVMAPTDAARPLTDILDSCLVELLRAARRDLLAELDRPLNTSACLVALGSAGRREFAIGSPLKLLFVHELPGTPPAGVSLTSEDAHGQHLQRFMRLVGNLSPEAMLFEAVPPYALPEGSGKVAACPLPALRDHFENAAEPWELRMLTHARVIEAEGQSRVNALRHSGIPRSREPWTGRRWPRTSSQSGSKLFQRHRLDDIWDIRNRPGGLDDLELLAEWLQLTGAATAPAMLVNGLVPTVTAAAEHGLIDESAATELAATARLWQCLDGYFRMTSNGAFDPGSAPAELREVIARVCGADEFDALPATIADASRRVAGFFDRLLDAAETTRHGHP